MKASRKLNSLRSSSANKLDNKTADDKLPSILITRASPRQSKRQSQQRYAEANEDLKVVTTDVKPERATSVLGTLSSKGSSKPSNNSLLPPLPKRKLSAQSTNYNLKVQNYSLLPPLTMSNNSAQSTND